MLSCKRALFSLPEDLHYLNSAYIGPLSTATQEAGLRGIRRKAVPSSITPDDFFRESDEGRRLFAALVGSPDPKRIAIIPAASYGIAVAVRNAPVSAGQNLVLLHEQFPSNALAWRKLAHRKGLQLRSVAPPERARARGAEWNARVLEAIDAATAVVALPHVHWTDGTLFDLERIGTRAREVGALFVVDGTQSVGALPIDVRKVRPDALVAAAYKWLLGPYSVGLAYFGERFDDGEPLEENWIARLGSEDFAGLVTEREEYQPGALRYDVGERSNFILMPMLNAALTQNLDWGAASIQEYCAGLTAELVHEARALGFVVEDAAWRATHLFGLRAPGSLDMDAVHVRLQERRVFVSRRGSALRISPHVYNDERDVAALLDVLRDARPRPPATA